MPCNSDHMKATPRELRSKELAGMLAYLDNEGYIKPKDVTHIFGPRDGIDIIHASTEHYYGNIGYETEFAQLLCTTLKTVPDDFIYDGTVKARRKLADWWDEHKAADAKRERAEKQARIKKEAEEVLKLKLDKICPEIEEYILEKFGKDLPEDIIKEFTSGIWMKKFRRSVGV